MLYLHTRVSLSSGQDVYDKVEYLSSLGKTQTAAVQRDADIGVAEAERDAGIRVRGSLLRKRQTRAFRECPLSDGQQLTFSLTANQQTGTHPSL